MQEVQITVDLPMEEIKARLGTLHDECGRVAVNALNRALVTGEKVLKQETAKVYNVRQKDVKAVLKMKRAVDSDLTAKLTYKDAHTNLMWFARADSSVMRPRYPIRSSNPYAPDPPHVFARVMKAHGMIPLSGRPKPFVQRAASSGNIALFQRVSDDPRAKLRGVSAPAIPQIVRNDDVIERFQKETKDTLEKRIDHEITRVLAGYNMEGKR